jgi:hypothetical protein
MMCQTSSAELVGAPEQQLEVPGSIPYQAFVLIREQLTQPVSDGKPGFGIFLDQDQLVL